jgi:hypothetical protein
MRTTLPLAGAVSPATSPWCSSAVPAGRRSTRASAANIRVVRARQRVWTSGARAGSNYLRVPGAVRPGVWAGLVYTHNQAVFRAHAVPAGAVIDKVYAGASTVDESGAVIPSWYASVHFEAGGRARGRRRRGSCCHHAAWRAPPSTGPGRTSSCSTTRRTRVTLSCRSSGRLRVEAIGGVYVAGEALCCGSGL